MTWSPSRLAPGARLVSVSRRTDVPALYGPWFLERLREGRAEGIPAGPPRRIPCSLRPEDLLGLVFWTKAPGTAFLRVLDAVEERGIPTVLQLTITGLGGTAAEPGVPPVSRVLEVLPAIAARLPPGAVAWRYDPVFLSQRFDPAHHRRVFAPLAHRLAPWVDRVICSFVEPYARRVRPDLEKYTRETGDRVEEPVAAVHARLAGWLRDEAHRAGLRLTLCGEPELSRRLSIPPAGCNAFSWLRRVWPDLASVPPPRRGRPLRPGCTCDVERDIGAYDTCTLGCRYCYATRHRDLARRRRHSHDPGASALVATPGSSASSSARGWNG